MQAMGVPIFRGAGEEPMGRLIRKAKGNWLIFDDLE